MKGAKTILPVLFGMFIFAALVGCNRNDAEPDFDYLHTDEITDRHYDLSYISHAELRSLASAMLEGSVVTPPRNMPPGMIDFTREDLRLRLVFNRLRNGEVVRFYDEFYRYFPGEAQYYFTYHEALEHDGRLAYISSFGNHNLKIIRGAPGYFRRAFLYFNPENPNADALVRPVHAAYIEAVRQTNRLIEIPDMPGYYIVYNNILDIMLGFVFTSGENYFSVRLGRNCVILGDFPCGNPRPLITNISNFPDTEIIEFIRGLHFGEFIGNWERYVG